MNKIILKSKYLEVVIDIRSWALPLTIDFNVGVDGRVYRPVTVQILCFYFDLGIDPLQEYEDERQNKET